MASHTGTQTLKDNQLSSFNPLELETHLEIVPRQRPFYMASLGNHRRTHTRLPPYTRTHTNKTKKNYKITEHSKLSQKPSLKGPDVEKMREEI